MKVLIVSQYFWPETFRINKVVECLVEQGCEVVILTGQPNYPDGKIFPGYKANSFGCDERSRAGQILRVPIFPRGKSSAARLFLNYFSFVLCASIMGPFLLKGQKFDAILVFAMSPIFQAIPAIILRRIKRAPLIIWVQDLWPQSLKFTGFVKSKSVLKLVGLATTLIYRSAELILIQSPGFEADVRAKAPRTEIRYHPNPAEIAFGRSELAEPVVKLENVFNVVFAGNFGTATAMPTILDAASLLANKAEIRFILIGSGTMSNWIETAVRDRRLSNVQLPGRFPTEAMPAILEQASVLLVTLRRDDELSLVIPSKIPTYLASGKPIIAALEGEGARIVVEAKAGFAVPAEDANELASAILALSEMPEAEREQMGKCARAYYEKNFEPKHLAQVLVGHFEDAINITRR